MLRVPPAIMLTVLCASVLTACNQTSRQVSGGPKEDLFSTPALRQTMSESGNLSKTERFACFTITRETDLLIQKGQIAPDGEIESFTCNKVDRVAADQMIVSATMMAGGKSYPVQTDLRLVELPRMRDGRPAQGWGTSRYLFNGNVLIDR